MLLLPFLLAALPACRTHRILEVHSEPEGALVRLDQEVIGRTPLEHEFLHYGRRRLTLYRPGYRTWSERIHLDAPWYARFPLDLLTEVILPLGLTDRRRVQVTLVPDAADEDWDDPGVDAFARRAQTLRRAEKAAAGERR